MGTVRAHVFVSGFVQGVFFRSHAQNEAEMLNVSGWVRNLDDGRVEAVFEGEEGVVGKLVSWCREGPPEARVESVEVRWEQPLGETKGFRILR